MSAAALGARGRAALWAGKVTGGLSRLLRRGGGTTLPGDVARWIDPRILTKLVAALEDSSLAVTGTNGKTTTAGLLRHIFEWEQRPVVANLAGANLIFGVTAAMVRDTGWRGEVPARSGVFEIDEASLPQLVSEAAPATVVVTNLFRDQLDRYGELETTAARLRAALTAGLEGTTAVLNADDPMVATLGEDLPRVVYAGLDDPRLLRPQLPGSADAKFCPRCGTALRFDGVYFGHVGHYACPRGDFTRPRPDLRATAVHLDGIDRMTLTLERGRERAEVTVPLAGLYNAYNVVLAVAAAGAVGIPLARSAAALRTFQPAFGRLERVRVDGVPAVLLLAKNPTGFNEVLRTAIEFGNGHAFVIALNDRIADGQDVSWIWDVDFEQLRAADTRVVVCGDRAADLRVRLKYAQLPDDAVDLVSGWRAALHRAARQTPPGQTLFVLATYTAMLELRAVLTREGALQPYWRARRTDPQKDAPGDAADP